MPKAPQFLQNNKALSLTLCTICQCPFLQLFKCRSCTIFLLPCPRVGHNYYYIVFVSFLYYIGFFFLRFRLIDTQQAVTRLLFWITA